MSAECGLNGSFICRFVNFDGTPAGVTCHVARFRDPSSTDNFRQAHGVARPTVPREVPRLVLFVARAVVVLWRAATNAGFRRRQRSGCGETTLSRVDRITSPHVRRASGEPRAGPQEGARARRTFGDYVQA
jgi:hypothetical protein